MNNKKQLAINMIAQISSFVVSFFISFFVTPYIIQQIGVEAYGFVGLANEFVGYAQLITIALNSMAARFITIKLHEGDDEAANKYFNSVLLANGVVSVVLTIVGAIIIIFMDRIVAVPTTLLFDVRLLWILMFANFILGIITSVFGVATFAKNKLYLSSARQIEAQILRVIVLIICMSFLPPSTWYIGLAALASTSLISWYNYFYTKKLLPNIKIDKKHFDFSKLKELIASGIWNTVTKLGSILSSGLDLLITNKFVGATAMGVLSLAKTVPNLILSTIGSITAVFMPELTISYAKKKFNDIKTQLNFSIKLLGFITSIPMAILFAYGSEFYKLWAPTQDAQLLQILSIITCFAFVFSLPLEPLWNVFTVTNKVKQSSLYLLGNSIITIIIVFIGVNLTDNSFYQLVLIAGTSTFFSLIKSLVFLPLYGAKCVNLKYNTFYKPIFLNTLSVIFVTALSFIIKKVILINSWVMLILCCVITSILACFINYYLLLNKDERQSFIKKVKSITDRIYLKIMNPINKLIEKWHKKFTKTNNKYILIETEGDFCDNGRALYEYMIEHNYNKKYHIIWIVTSPKNYKKNAPTNVKFISRTKNGIIAKWQFYKYINKVKYFFFTHPYWLDKWKEDQTVINLWHGTPLKAGGKDLSNIYNYFASPSTKTFDLYNKFIGVKKSQYVVTGMPRNDLLYRKSQCVDKLIDKNKDTKVIISMTTFRQSTNMTDSNIEDPYALSVINSMEEAKQLNKYLKEKNIIILVKIHHLQKTEILNKVSLSQIKYIEDKDLMEKDIQLYELLGQMDGMLSDYSSVTFDYSLLDRPMGFFTNGIDDYKKTRGFLVDNILEYMPGHKIDNLKDFYKFIDDFDKGIDKYKEERENICKLGNEYKDNKNSERVIKMFLKEE